MKDACRLYGAEVVELAGTLREVGAAARATELPRRSFDLSTLREPYRVEGKKTMGLEIFEQLPGDQFPDAVVYPTGGGTGLVGMYRAFQQLREFTSPWCPHGDVGACIGLDKALKGHVGE